MRREVARDGERARGVSYPLAQLKVGPGAQPRRHVFGRRRIRGWQHKVAVRIAQQHLEGRDLSRVTHAVRVRHGHGRPAGIHGGRELCLRCAGRADVEREQTQQQR